MTTTTTETAAILTTMHNNNNYNDYDANERRQLHDNDTQGR